MDLFAAISARRSVRAFRPGEVPEDVLAACLEAARLAPSASNMQPWRFLVARDPASRAALAAAGYDQPALATAPVVTILLADRSRHRERLRRSKELVDAGAFDDDSLERAKTGYAIREAARETARRGMANAGSDAARAWKKAEIDAELAAGAMVAGEHYALAAVALGYAACWIGLFDENAARAVGGWPDTCFAVAMLPTGVPAIGQDKLPPRPRLPLAGIAWREKAGTPWI